METYAVRPCVECPLSRHRLSLKVISVRLLMSQSMDVPDRSDPPRHYSPQEISQVLATLPPEIRGRAILNENMVSGWLLRSQ